MKQHKIFVMMAVVALILMIGCSGPQPHLFVYKYSQPEALKACRTSLVELGYKIAVFDVSAGVLKTVSQKFISPEDDTWVNHQIVITLTRAHEMRVKVVPKKAIEYRDEIMEPIVKAFEEAGIHAKYIPPPRPRPWRRPPPPHRRRLP
jgi:hypothetical protein